MKWDEVEREFFVIGVNFDKLSSAFIALAMALRRERESDRMALNEEAVTQSKKVKDGRESPTPSLPF